MATTIPSYRLKMSRAYKHINDVEDLMADINSQGPYTVRESHKPKRKDGQYVYTVELLPLGEAEDVVACVLGDYLHNVRSALDHLAVALNPRSRKGKVYFPISLKPISYEEPAKCPHCGRDSGNMWLRSTKGMDRRAVAIIEAMQPCNLPLPGPIRGIQPIRENNLLYVLSQFSNLDKHREALPLEWAVSPTGVTVDGKPLPVEEGRFVKDGAEVISSPHPVNVNLEGPLTVGLRTGDSFYKMPEVGVDLLWHVAMALVDPLEKFVR